MGDDEDRQAMRNVPQSDLDYNMMLTAPKWGQNEDIHPNLTSQFKVVREVKEKDGTVHYEEENSWNLMSFFTQDFRLANLDKEKLNFVNYYTDLAHDLLQSGMKVPFVVAVERGGSVLELSQSLNGFLRRRHGTFTKENKNQELEPAKRSIFGGKKEGM